MTKQEAAYFSDHIRPMRDRARSAVGAVRTAAVFGDGDTGMDAVDAAIDALAVEADTNRTMYLAWRKRAEESEAKGVGSGNPASPEHSVPTRRSEAT